MTDFRHLGEAIYQFSAHLIVDFFSSKNRLFCLKESTKSIILHNFTSQKLTTGNAERSRPVFVTVSSRRGAILWRLLVAMVDLSEPVPEIRDHPEAPLNRNREIVEFSPNFDEQCKMLCRKGGVRCIL